ncbi:hypothetical protein Tco_1500043 [Tanacetum coccineum]
MLPFRCVVLIFGGVTITLRVDNEAVTFNLDQTTRYSSTNDKSVNRIDIIDAVCEEYAPELLGFSSGGNPTPTSEPFTSEFILEKIEAYLKDDSISPEIDHADCDPEKDICLIKQSKVTEAKSSIEEPPELELKDLPSHLEYAYLEENKKLPVIIAKGLKDDEKDALLKVLKSHKKEKMKETEDKIKEGTLQVDQGTDAMTLVLGKEKGGYAREWRSGVTYNEDFDLPRDNKPALMKEFCYYKVNLMLRDVRERKNYNPEYVQQDVTEEGLVSPVEIHPINSSADEEGGTTVVGCDQND